MIDLRPHLGVDRQSAIEFVAWFGEEAHCKFALEHEDTDSRSRVGCKKFESQGRGDLSDEGFKREENKVSKKLLPGGKG